MKKISVLAILLLAFVLAACSPAAPTAVPVAATTAPTSAPAATTAPAATAPNPTNAPTEPSTPSGPAPWSLIAVGDSLPFNSPDDCPHCTGFVDRYAAAITQATGHPVKVQNLSQHNGLQTDDLLEELKTDVKRREALANADIIIVSIGNNDTPWNRDDDPCDGAGYPVWSKFNPTCAAAAAEIFRPKLESVFSQIVALRAGKPTIFRTINGYNDWLGGIDQDSGSVTPPEATTPTRLVLDAWSAMTCKAAEANGFACADTYHAFNGPDGLKPIAGDLTATKANGHPSDKGNEVIARVLADLGYAPLVPTATSAATPTDAPTATAVQQTATFEGLSSGLDNAKQARIRAISAVMDAPGVDVYVNGLPVVNGGKTRQNMGDGRFSGWVYVTPGTYTVALVPHDGTIDQALFAPVAVNAEAGHRYTVAAVGQLKEKNIKPLIVDETALEAGIGAKAADNTGISINNLQGVDGIDHLMNGKLAASIKYGEAKASICSSDSFQNEAFTVAGKPSPSFAAGDFWCVPALSSAAVWYGDYPGNIIGGDNSQGTSELNVLDFLAAFNGRHVDVDGHLLTFNTVLTAIEKAGMHDQFAKSGPYFFFAPSDEVFAALPADQRNALLNDPQALAQQLKAHLIEGYYPYGSLSGATYGQADRELTNLLGQKLSLLDSAINGQDETGPNFTIGNGNRLQIIYELLPVK